MISKKEAKAIKILFGPGFSEKIAQRIRERGKVRNQNGTFFKPHSISDVLNQKAHSVLEEEIREIWERELELREKKTLQLIKRTKAVVS